MSRNFLFILLLLTVTGLLWGAQVDRPSGAKADNTLDNNEGSSRIVVFERGNSEIIRVPYLVMRAAGRLPMSLLRMIARLPRQAAVSVTQSLTRLMDAFKNYSSDVLGYLASSDRKELTRVRRGVPGPASKTKSSPQGINVPFLIFRLFTYPIKTAYRTTYTALRFSPLAGTLNLISSITSSGSVLFHNPLMRKVNNITMQIANFAAAGAWNFTRSTVLPQLDDFVTNLRDSDSLPDTVMSILTELQTLYHIFKFLGMA